jgi:glycosyltransferase involved in cell wall biosynthesis
LEKGGRVLKNFDCKLKIVFAGRMDEAKGIDILMDVLETLPRDKTDEWIFIGDGPLKSDLEDLVVKAQINARFYGFVSQDKVKEVLTGAHVLVMPSKSEGFPKIVAEAWNYGVIPVVSPVGSLPHYIENGINGFLMKSINSESLYNSLMELITSNSFDLEEISKHGNQLASKFTFENYLRHLKQEVFV